MDIDWEELQATFLSTRRDREYLLDREQGEVVSLPETEDGEEDGGEEVERDEGEENLRLEMENDPDRFVEISPIPISDQIEWMSAFLQTMKEKDLAKELTQALNSAQPEKSFDRILRKKPTERARWLGFFEAQVQEIIDGWIEENDVESDTPPPWKVKAPRHRPKKSPESE